MPHEFNIGDRVSYTPRFLSRHRRYTKHIESAQGIVAAVCHLDTGTILADVLWNKPAIPRYVNIKDLTRINDGAAGK